MLCRGVWFVNYCHRPDRISLLCVRDSPGCEAFLSQFTAQETRARRSGGARRGASAGKQRLTQGQEPVDPTAVRLGLFPSLTALSKLKPGPSLQPCQLPPSLTHWEGALCRSTPQSQFLTFETPPSLSSLNFPLP